MATNTDKYLDQHLKDMNSYDKKIAKLYDEATKEAAKIGVSVPHFDPNRPFDAKNYPSSSKKLNKIVEELMRRIQVVIENGIEEQWEIANSKDNEMCHLAFGSRAAAMTGEQLSKYFNNHDEALNAFQTRKVSGLGLSDRIWNLTEQFKEQVEMAIDLGLRDGVSAARMSTTLKQYLNDPDKLFRRVRDEHGVLRLSKAAKSYHPGQGRYRSSHKNAMRLARTETNMAYRTADHLRIQDFDFVVGIEVHRSNHPYPCPVCEALAGKYPKDFKFVGWHPQCRCYTTTILKDDEEFWNDLDNDTNTPSKNEVKEPPKGFNDWVKDNKDRIERAEKKGNPAYFLRDNKGYVDGALGKSAVGSAKTAHTTPKAPTAAQIKAAEEAARKNMIAEAAVKRHASRDAEGIQSRWDERKRKMEIQAIAEQRHANRDAVAIQKAWDERKLLKQSKLKDIAKSMGGANIEYKEVGLLNGALQESEIIAKIGGGDLTRGSCSSLAFTYAGNKCGYDVTDFRGGVSCQTFSSSRTIMDIAEKSGGAIVENYNDFSSASQLLKTMTSGKEYYFTCGRHAAVVRKTTAGYEYLELQSSVSNGFKPLTNDILKYRFGAQKSHSWRGRKLKTKECAIDIDLLKADIGFKDMLGYLNTATDKQLKGLNGSIK